MKKIEEKLEDWADFMQCSVVEVLLMLFGVGCFLSLAGRAIFNAIWG